MNSSKAARIIIQDFFKYNRERREDRAKLKKFLKEQRISTSKAVKMLRKSINKDHIRKQKRWHRKSERSGTKKDSLEASHGGVTLDAFTQYLMEELSSDSDESSSAESDEETSLPSSLWSHEEKTCSAAAPTTPNIVQ